MNQYNHIKQNRGVSHGGRPDHHRTRGRSWIYVDDEWHHEVINRQILCSDFVYESRDDRETHKPKRILEWENYIDGNLIDHVVKIKITVY